MNRAAQLMNNLFVPASLGGIMRNYRRFRRNYLVSRRSGYQEIGAEPETSCWIKLIIYLGSAVAIILATVAFAYGYVIIPAISSSVTVVCAALFWFRNSTIWGRLLECSRNVFCFPCIYFERPVPPDAEIRNERRHRQLLFERPVEAQNDGPEEQSEAQNDGPEEQSEAQNPSSEASSESESSVTIDSKPVKVQNVTEI